jgi:hypothetical protein
MAGGLSASEEFMVLFNRLKEATAGNPERVRVFYNQSEAIRDALKALNAFLIRTDLERRLSLGVKLLKLGAPGFHAAWREYKDKWQFRISTPNDALMEFVGYELGFEEADPARKAALEERLWKEAVVELIEPEPVASTELEPPDPKTEDSFDPLTHDGGAAIEQGFECLETFSYPELDQEWDNRRSIALGVRLSH